MPELMPNADKMVFKPEFRERYSQLTDWEQFKKFSLSFLRRSIRINTLLGTIQDIRKGIEAKGWILEPIPWCEEGFYISHPERREDFFCYFD